MSFNSLSLRQKQSVGEHKLPYPYKLKTGTGGLRNHLFDHHADAWIAACDKLGIAITCMKAKVDAHHAHSSGEKESAEIPLPDDRKSYSHKAFADALIEWITVNDQVC